MTRPLNRKEIKRRKRAAKQRFREYKAKHNLELPSCQFPNCNRENVETTIPDITHPEELNFFCKEHMSLVYNPPKDGPIIHDIPDSINYKTAPEITKRPGGASRKHANDKLKDFLERHNKTLPPDLECEVCSTLNYNSDKENSNEIIPYIKDPNYWYKVIFICKSCQGKIKDPQITKTIESIPTKDLKEVSQDQLADENANLSMKAGTIDLAKRFLILHESRIKCSNCSGDEHDKNQPFEDYAVLWEDPRYPFQFYALCKTCDEAFSDPKRGLSGTKGFLEEMEAGIIEPKLQDTRNLSNAENKIITKERGE